MLEDALGFTTVNDVVGKVHVMYVSYTILYWKIHSFGPLTGFRDHGCTGKAIMDEPDGIVGKLSFNHNSCIAGVCRSV